MTCRRRYGTFDAVHRSIFASLSPGQIRNPDLIDAGASHVAGYRLDRFAETKARLRDLARDEDAVFVPANVLDRPREQA
jgi:hypothetical protein